MSKKISQDAACAFVNAQAFSRSNTQVSVDNVEHNVDGGVVWLSLHGNVIASYESSKGLPSVEFTLSMWNTVTTRERLNALLSVLSPMRLSVVQRKGLPYIESWDVGLRKQDRLMPFPEVKTGYGVSPNVQGTGHYDWVSLLEVENHFKSKMSV